MASDKSKDSFWAQMVKALIEAYLKGQTGNYGLSPQRILQVARETVGHQEAVFYKDFDADLFVEILDGVRPSTVAWKLFRIKQVLEDNGWRYQGKSKFLPPI